MEFIFILQFHFQKFGFVDAAWLHIFISKISVLSFYRYFVSSDIYNVEGFIDRKKMFINVTFFVVVGFAKISPVKNMHK